MTGSFGTVTYTFADVVKALNEVLPYDWAGFLNARLNAIAPAPLEGLKRGGYKLVYTEKASDFFESGEKNDKISDLSFSLGLVLDGKDATVTSVIWDGPAFNAGVTAGSQIIAVNGTDYDADGLKDAIKDASKSPAPIELLIKRGDQYRTIAVNYHGGLRYPHLERIPNTPALLDDVLRPR
jgi:predicted metalloprotease with PDZ domain